jgi:hypothetical protein
MVIACNQNITSSISTSSEKRDLGHPQKVEGPNSLASQRVVGPNPDEKKKKNKKTHESIQRKVGVEVL